MSKKYLTLDEAASMLSVAPDELIRMRERGDIRGFADRGTWKFKHDDVETLVRSRQADSNPEVPLFDADESDDIGLGPESDLALSSAEGGDESASSDVGEQPTVIRRDALNESDEHLLLEDEGVEQGDPLMDSDSDVRLVGGPEVDLDFDSDSDVKLVGMDSDSDVPLEGTSPEFEVSGEGSDSDVQLVGDEDSLDSGDEDSVLIGSDADDESLLKIDDEISLNDSDSDVQLIADDSDSGDVSIVDDEDAIAIDFDEDRTSQGSVLADESGISLGGDSSLMLGAESGISLEGPSDSGIALDAGDDEGITLALDDDSGISIDAGDSGISLESVGDSGISLEDDSHSGTIPMMEIVSDEDEVDQTQLEIPSLDDADSAYDLQMEESGDETEVLDLQEAGEIDSDFDDAEFDLDDADTFDSGDEFEADELDMEDDAFADDEEDLDVFDADDEVFEEAGDDEEFASPVVGRMAMTETEWGTGTFVGLTIATLCLLLCGAVMIDLVKNTATAASPNPVSGMVLDMLGGLYKG